MRKGQTSFPQILIIADEKPSFDFKITAIPWLQIYIFTPRGYSRIVALFAEPLPAAGRA